MTISIFGCGWLGLPLGNHLIYKNHQVWGTTTQTSKLKLMEQMGIKPVLLKLPLENEPKNEAIYDSEVIIIAIPPRVNQFGNEHHVNQVKDVLHHINQPNAHVIYISSTSVYANDNTEKTEESPVLQDNPLVLAENEIIKSGFDYTILRFGGLMGYDRFAGKYYAGKTITEDHSGVNYIHLDDAIAIITQIINQKISHQIFNICAPLHPSRKEVIENDCKKHYLPIPIFEAASQAIHFKIINPQKWINLTDYTFLYPNPLHFK